MVPLVKTSIAAFYINAVLHIGYEIIENFIVSEYVSRIVSHAQTESISESSSWT